MNTSKSQATGLLLFLLLSLTAPRAQAQRSYEPTRSTLDHLDDLILQQPASLPQYRNDSLWYFSQPGQRPASIFTDGFESGNTSRFDANGDGTNELVLVRDDSEGNPTRLMVYDTVVKDTLFTINLTLPDYAPILSRQVQFEGFYDFLGTGTKDIIFGGDGVIIVDAENTTHPVYERDATYRYFGVADFNGDNKGNLLVGNTQVRRIEIYTFFEEE